MHVGLDLLFLVPGETGGREVYARELVRALQLERPGLRLTALVSAETAAHDGDAFEGVPAVALPVRSRDRRQWAYGQLVHVPRAAERAGVDVLHSLANTGTATGSFRRVLSLHDVLFHLFPRFHTPLQRVATEALVRIAGRRADRVIAVSHAAARDLVRHLHVPAGRIDVVPNGVGLPAGARDTAPAALRGRLGLDERPYVYCGALQLAHKNLPRLVEALALLAPDQRPQLVLSGGDPGPELGELVQRLGLARDVRAAGWLEPADVNGLYAGAICAVLPSLYEGFGLPVLEAMTRGVPVVCSDIAALREVAGSAARRFDPYEPRSIARALAEVLGDAALRRRMIAAGREQAAGFTWQAAARGTLASYERALRSP